MPYQRNPSSIFSLPNYNVKESSNVNNFPSNTNMIPSHLNTSYQIIPVNPHLIKMLYPVSRALSHKTQHATRPTRITSLFPRLHLVSSRDRRSFHEKITTFKGAKISHNNAKRFLFSTTTRKEEKRKSHRYK